MNKHLNNRKLPVLLFCTAAAMLFFGCQTALIVEETASSKAELYNNYGARYCDAAMFQFSVADPQAETHYSVSPYSYILNTPIQIDSLTKVLLFPAEPANKE